MLMRQENKLESNLLEDIFNAYEIGIHHTKPPGTALAADHREGKEVRLHYSYAVLKCSNSIQRKSGSYWKSKEDKFFFKKKLTLAFLVYFAHSVLKHGKRQLYF